MTPQDKKIYGLIGYPVKHSLSPQMHNAAFRACKINAEYKLFEIKAENLEEFLLDNILVQDINGESFYSQEIEGFNITIPHKVKAREILENKFPSEQNDFQQENLYYVKLSGAVNTVKREGNRLRYWNTDATGFLKSLEQDLGFEPKDKKVLLIGCGGVGRAIIASLSWKNVVIQKIYINDIKEEAINSAKEHFSKFAHLKDKLEFILTEDILKVIKDCDLLINASAVGMEDAGVSAIDKNLLHEGLYVYDVVYNQKAETRLVKDASSLGLAVVGGLSMLLYQGVDAFELWMDGQKAPIEIMRSALNK